MSFQMETEKKPVVVDSITVEWSVNFNESVAEDCYNGWLKYGNSPVEEQVTAIQFVSRLHAEKAKSDLIKGGKHMATPILIVEHSVYRAFLLVERLYRLMSKDETILLMVENGLSVQDTRNMWTIQEGVCIGFTDTYKAVFQQMSLGMKGLHDESLKHGNLGDGVFYNREGKIKLCNTKPVNALKGDQSYENDFKALNGIMEKFIKLKPMPKNPKTLKWTATTWDASPPSDIPFDVKAYYYMIDHPIFQSYKEKSEWIYNPPLFWPADIKGIFLDSMAKLLKENVKMFDVIVDDWWDRHDQSKTPILWTTYTHDKNDKYYRTDDTTLLPFGRNFHQHADNLWFSIDIFKYLESVFPELISYLYIDMLHEISKYSGQTAPTDIHDGSKPGDITLEEFFRKQLSLYRKHDW